jgi:hypothetical protein
VTAIEAHASSGSEANAVIMNFKHAEHGESAGARRLPAIALRAGPRSFERAVRRGPSEFRRALLLALGVCLLPAASYGESDSASTAETELQLGMHDEGTGNYSRALEHYRASAAAAPSSRLARNTRNRIAWIEERSQGASLRSRRSHACGTIHRSSMILARALGWQPKLNRFRRAPCARRYAYGSRRPGFANQHGTPTHSASSVRPSPILTRVPRTLFWPSAIWWGLFWPRDSPTRPETK